MQKDIFVEKIVKRKKTGLEYLLTYMLLLSAFFLIVACFIIPFIFYMNLIAVSAIISFGIGFLTYRIITSFNKDYEYSITNDELLIDLIVAERKRHRVFTGSCKEFTIVAPITGADYTAYRNQGLGCLDFRSGDDVDAGWFFVARRSGQTFMVLFEPDDRFIDAFKRYIPRLIKSE